MAKDEPGKFPGVTSPNTTQVPDQYLDELLPVLTAGELKVLLYITRRTFGFKKASDTISLSQLLHGIRTRDGRQLDRGTGLSKKTLLAALRGLKARNVILSERRRSAERGDEPTSYRLNIIPSPDPTPPAEPVGEQVPHGGGGETPPGPWGENSPTQQTGEHHTARQQTASSNDSNSKVATAPSPTTAAQPLRHSSYLLALISDFSTDFGDTGHTRANYTRLMRLLTASGLSEEAFGHSMFEARSITRDEINRRRLARTGTPVHKAMPYFFEVLRDVLGLREGGQR